MKKSNATGKQAPHPLDRPDRREVEERLCRKLGLGNRRANLHSFLLKLS